MLRIFKKYYPVRNIFFVMGEGLVILTSVLLAVWLLMGMTVLQDGAAVLFKAMLITMVCQTFLYYNDLYDLRVTDSLTETGIRLLQALGAAAIFLALIYLVFPGAIIGHGIFAASVAIVILLIASWRFGYMHVLDRGLFDQKIILLGSGELARDILREIEEKKDSGYQVPLALTECEADGARLQAISPRCRCVAKYAGLVETVRSMDIQTVVVAITDRRGRFPTDELLRCRVQGIRVLDGTSFYEELTGKLIVEQIKPSWLIFSDGFRKSRTRRFLKRATDITFAVGLMAVCAPLMLVTAMMVKIESRGPAIFSQERVGQDKRPYLIHKFRSMVADAEKYTGPVWAQDDDDRITRIGRLIRKLRIDELPQLWNVLKGEMSLVGPRPERAHFVDQLEAIIPFYRERFSVKPGITGWAQVSYGYGASVQDAIAKLNYDLFYIKNLSFFMDIMIAPKTVKIVLFRRGAR